MLPSFSSANWDYIRWNLQMMWLSFLPENVTVICTEFWKCYNMLHRVQKNCINIIMWEVSSGFTSYFTHILKGMGLILFEIGTLFSLLLKIYMLIKMAWKYIEYCNFWGLKINTNWNLIVSLKENISFLHNFLH